MASDSQQTPPARGRPLPAASLRPAAADDLDALCHLELASHRAAWVREGFAAELSKPYSRVWVLTDDATDSELYAYIVFWMLEGVCQILNVVVQPDYRGQGVAGTLVRKALSEAMRQGCKRAWLEVRKSNTPAIQAYQKVGFVITKLIRSFYSDGEDAYEMTLELELGPDQQLIPF